MMWGMERADDEKYGFGSVVNGEEVRVILSCFIVNAVYEVGIACDVEVRGGKA